MLHCLKKYITTCYSGKQWIDVVRVDFCSSLHCLEGCQNSTMKSYFQWISCNRYMEFLVIGTCIHVLWFLNRYGIYVSYWKNVYIHVYCTYWNCFSFIWSRGARCVLKPSICMQYTQYFKGFTFTPIIILTQIILLQLPVNAYCYWCE